MLDTQTVKVPFAEVRGYDGGKRIVGRKRHIAVDTDRRLPMVNLTTADVSDSVGAQTILAAIHKRWPWLKHPFADAGYDRAKLMDKATFLDFVVEIVRRSDKKGFHLLPRGWVVERTFGWMIRWRRLVWDYERRLDVSEAMFHPGGCRTPWIRSWSGPYFVNLSAPQGETSNGLQGVEERAATIPGAGRL
jgi:putative transposase